MLIAHRFDTLDTLINRVHLLFDYWRHMRLLTPPLDATQFEVARRTVHEWMVNLVQHADFGNRPPEIGLRIFLDVNRVRFAIEDNSAGFDLPLSGGRSETSNRGVPINSDTLSDRSFGLQIITVCTNNLAYRYLGTHWHRVTFDVLPDPKPCIDRNDALNMPFYVTHSRRQ